MLSKKALPISWNSRQPFQVLALDKAEDKLELEDVLELEDMEPARKSPDMEDRKDKLPNPRNAHDDVEEEVGMPAFQAVEEGKEEAASLKGTRSQSHPDLFSYMLPSYSPHS